jgi:hypothetical protein
MTNSNLASFQGPNIALRLIQPEDAHYLHALRVNPTYNQHLSAVQGSAEGQRRWIEDYKSREAEECEFYYIIERKDGRACGAVRLYNIDADSFTWGSWILDANKPPKAALESAVLSFGIGFEVLERKIANVDVRVANVKAQIFYRRFNMVQSHSNETDIFFTYERSQFEADRDGHMAILDETTNND